MNKKSAVLAALILIITACVVCLIFLHIDQQIPRFYKIPESTCALIVSPGKKFFNFRFEYDSNLDFKKFLNLLKKIKAWLVVFIIIGLSHPIIVSFTINSNRQAKDNLPIENPSPEITPRVKPKSTPKKASNIWDKAKDTNKCKC